VLYGAFAERAAHTDATFGDPEVLLGADDITAWRELPLFWIASERVKRERDSVGTSKWGTRHAFTSGVTAEKGGDPECI